MKNNSYYQSLKQQELENIKKEIALEARLRELFGEPEKHEVPRSEAFLALDAAYKKCQLKALNRPKPKQYD